MKILLFKVFFFKKNIGKNDTEKTSIQQFTVISNSLVYHSVTNWTLVNNFVYNEEKTRLHVMDLIEQEKLKVAGSIFLTRDRILNTNKYSFNNYS